MGFAVADAAGTEGDEGLPSGAVESIVVCCSGEVGSDVFGTVEGRVVFAGGLTVVRTGAAVALAAGLGFVVADDAEAEGALAGTSR